MSTAFDATNRCFEQLFNSADKNKYQGREEIKAFVQGARDLGVDNLRLTPGTVLEAGQDQLIEKSSYEHSLDRSTYQVTWKRVAPGKNEWLIDTDISN